MDKKIEMAIDDIALIRRVIERTRQDFSRISVYFIGIGKCIEKRAISKDIACNNYSESLIIKKMIFPSRSISLWREIFCAIIYKSVQSLFSPRL